MPPPQKGSVRFTPEEIKALMDAGEMTMPIIQSLNPEDLKVWQSLADERTSGGQDFQKMTAAGAGGLGVLGAIPGAVGKVGSSIAGVGGGLATGLGFGLGNWLMQKAGVPAEGRNAVTMGVGFGMMGKGAAKGAAAAEGAALSAEEATIVKGLQQKGYPPALIEKILAADKGKGGPVMPPAAGSNVINEGSQTGTYSDVSKGFHPGGGLFEFPDKGGQVADPAAFQRALEEELQWIQKQKGLTNSNATTSSYDDWAAQQESKFPPTGTSIKDLATKGSASLRKPPTTKDPIDLANVSRTQEQEENRRFFEQQWEQASKIKRRSPK